MEDEETKKRINKEAKLIEKALGNEDVRKFQQTNISDFFFSMGGTAANKEYN